MFKNIFFLLMMYSVVSQNADEIAIDTVSNINLSGGTLMRVENFPSNFIQPRHVDVWVPNNYSNSKKYAVLYMQDGQMLFDSTTTWNKQEWKVDEVATRLMNEEKTNDFIVVGIWNIAALRNSNYFPEKVFQMMSERAKDSLKETGKKQNWINTINSNNYLRFIVKELKPFIDSHFSTFTDRENTGIMGSSRGGLISMYAISEYPEVFGSAACLSTHWIGTYNIEDNRIPDTFMEYMKHHLPDSKTHRIYFDYGNQTLDALYLPFQKKVSEVLLEKGYDKNILYEGADHSENSWSERLEIPLIYLFEKKSD